MSSYAQPDYSKGVNSTAIGRSGTFAADRKGFSGEEEYILHHFRPLDGTTYFGLKYSVLV